LLQNILLFEDECRNFLNTVLEWPYEKIVALSQFNEPKSVEEYLDALALDENGLRNHSFVQSSDENKKSLC